MKKNPIRFSLLVDKNKELINRLTRAGYIAPTLNRDIEILNKFKYMRKSGIEKPEIYATLSAEYSISEKWIKRSIKKMNDYI